MLAVAAKKRLLLFHHDGNEFVELKELALPDAAVALAWTGESVCVATKKECGPHLVYYVSINGVSIMVDAGSRVHSRSSTDQ